MTAADRIRAALAGDTHPTRGDVASLLVERDYLAGQVERIAGSWLADQLMLADRRIRAAERILGEVVEAGSDTIGGSVAQALAVLRGEQS